MLRSRLGRGRLRTLTWLGRLRPAQLWLVHLAWWIVFFTGAWAIDETWGSGWSLTRRTAFVVSVGTVMSLGIMALAVHPVIGTYRSLAALVSLLRRDRERIARLAPELESDTYRQIRNQRINVYVLLCRQPARDTKLWRLKAVVPIGPWIDPLAVVAVIAGIILAPRWTVFVVVGILAVWKGAERVLLRGHGRPLARRLSKRMHEHECVDCGYQLSRIASLPNAGPRSCPECGSLWPLVPPRSPEEFLALGRE